MQLARAVCGGLLVVLAAGLLTGLAQAQTLVSGAIAADTRWSLANSPYVVNADIVVQGGATLTIDAGVLISMAPGTRLTVQTGTLRALGTAANPIRVLSERTRLGQAAAAGDWDQWIFAPGTSANTRLEHVQFEHGRGLLVQGSAPVFNHLDIRNQQGAAITIDLAASPTGVGNQASGNGLNGIAVPDGAITGSTRWGLRGIPYVLASGTVSVGAAPAISSVSPSVVEQGQSLQLSVNGARLTGVAAASLNSAGLSVVPASGGSSAQALLQLSVAANAALGPATLRLLVDAGEILLPNALTVTPPIPAITSISPTSVVAGTGPSTLTLDGRNFLASSVVTANAAALPTEWISTTQLRATLPLQTAAASLPLQVRSPNAQQPDQPLLSNIVTLTVQAPVPPVLAVEPTPLAIPPDNVTRGFQITLSKADFRDHTVAAAIDHPAIATVSPASATITAGQTRMLFQVTGKSAGLTTLRLTSPTLGAVSVPVFVTADYAGINSATAPVVGVLWNTATAPVSTSTGLYSSQVGLTFGSAWVDTQPRGTVKGSSTTLVLSGVALPAGLSVAVQPPEGVTLGAVTLNAEGTAASVPVSVAVDAVPGMRRLVVTAGTQVLVPAAPGGDRFSVWYEPPVVASVEPILGLPGSTIGSFVVRGRNLFEARPLSFSGDGITAASAPVVSAEGTVISTAIAISPAAAPGPRTVVVTTPSGDSGSAATSANTFSVIQQAGPAVSGLAAAVVGVTLEAPASPTSSSLGLVAPQVGVGLGSLLHAVQPATGATGQGLVLTLTGRELAGVTAATLTPATGVTLGTPVPASDGLSVQLPVSIAADAPLAMRRMQLLAGTTAIPVLQGADRFTVTAPVPVLDSVQPLVVPVGGSTTLTLRGIYLQNVTAVRLTPSAGITVGTPAFNAADPLGPSLSVTLVVDATAAVGSRVITAVAPAGESSGTAGVTNTITVAANAGTTVPSYLSAQVGVQLAGVTTPVVPDPLALYSSGVGVEFAGASAPVAESLGLLSPQVGIAYGPVLTSVEPLGLNVGQGGSVVVRGVGLPADAVLSFLPATGLTLEGAPVVAADGSSLTQAVSIAVDALVQPRAVILSSGGKTIPNALQGNSLFSVGGGAPAIVSMSPILARQGEAFTLLLRGTQLQELVEVSAEPALGLQFGSAPVVSADGTQVEVRVFVTPDAPLGARVIRVRTRTGLSAVDAGAANTFTVFSP